MIWRLMQAVIITGVAGWLLASGATTNGLAAGFVGAVAARGVTVAAFGLLGWRERRSMRLVQQSSSASSLTMHVDQTRFLP
jgi:hypothetical protein